MQRLRHVRNVPAAVVQQTVHTGGGELFALAHGVVGEVAAQVIGVPQQHTDAHATGGGEAKHIHHTQAAARPQGDGVVVQTYVAQAGDQCLL